MEKLFEVIGYEENATCVACEKTDKECVVIRTEAYAGPHCSRCATREAKKRAKNKAAPHRLPTGDGEHS